jgi:hypothetical protein
VGDLELDGRITLKWTLKPESYRLTERQVLTSFEVVTAMKSQTMVFRTVTSCTDVVGYHQRFRGRCWRQQVHDPKYTSSSLVTPVQLSPVPVTRGKNIPYIRIQ